VKTIAFISPSSGGHHDTYCRFYTRAMLELGQHVAVFTSTPDELKQWLEQACPTRLGQLQIVPMHYTGRRPQLGPLSVLLGKIDWVRFTAASVKNTGLKPDLVFHAWLDNCVSPGLTAGVMDALFSYPWSGLYFHPWYLRSNTAHIPFARLRLGPLATHAALQSRRCPAVAVLDEGIAPKLQAALGGKPVFAFPDVADETPPDLDFPLLAQIREQAAGRRVVGLLGALSRRKGVRLLLETARRATADNWFFFMAGEKFSDTFLPEEEQWIAELAGASRPNCLCHFQRLPGEAQFNALVSACDVIFAVYQNFASSSNLLTKAAHFEKPVLVSNAFCMGERVRQYGLGLAIDETSVEACQAALHQLGQQLDAGRFPAAPFVNYRRQHSVEQLRLSLGQLCAAAGL
jgi:hypothetical protein